MKLKELQNMIKEEFESYMKEDDVDVSVGDADVDLDAPVDGEIGEEEPTPEETLRAIFDQLKAFFEPEGEEDLGDEELPVDDLGDDEADLEENSTKEAKYQKQGYAAGGKKSSGANAGYGSVGGKGGTGYDAGSKALQERFQKLANIKTLKG
jgi:hypothetical protein